MKHRPPAASASVPARACSTNWYGRVALSKTCAHSLGRVLATRRRKTSPVAMPRTLPSGLHNAVRSEPSRQQHLPGHELVRGSWPPPSAVPTPPQLQVLSPHAGQASRPTPSGLPWRACAPQVLLASDVNALQIAARMKGGTSCKVGVGWRWWPSSSRKSTSSRASQAASVVDVARGGHVGTATSESISVGQASPF